MKSRKLIISVLTMLILIFASVEYSQKQSPSQNGTYHVLRVVDGDTFMVNYNGKDEYVRLIGINTPETVKPNSPVEYYGKEASNYTKSIINGKYVRLEFDVEQTDKYGRLLAYVYLEDGKMLNEILVRDGFAQVMTVPPNVKFADRFIELQRQARNESRGLWNEK